MKLLNTIVRLSLGFQLSSFVRELRYFFWVQLEICVVLKYH